MFPLPMYIDILRALPHVTIAFNIIHSAHVPCTMSSIFCIYYIWAIYVVLYVCTYNYIIYSTHAYMLFESSNASSSDRSTADHPGAWRTNPTTCPSMVSATVVSLQYPYPFLALRFHCLIYSNWVYSVLALVPTTQQ